MNIVVLSLSIYYTIICKAVFGDIKFYIYLFYIVCAVSIIILFIIPFTKISIFQKIFMFILTIFILFGINLLDSYYNLLKFEVCMDTRICREGVEIKHKGKNIIINEQSCNELNGKWK